MSDTKWDCSFLGMMYSFLLSKWSNYFFNLLLIHLVQRIIYHQVPIAIFTNFSISCKVFCAHSLAFFSPRVMTTLVITTFYVKEKKCFKKSYMFQKEKKNSAQIMGRASNVNRHTVHKQSISFLTYCICVLHINNTTARSNNVPFHYIRLTEVTAVLKIDSAQNKPIFKKKKKEDRIY